MLLGGVIEMFVYRCLGIEISTAVYRSRGRMMEVPSVQMMKILGFPMHYEDIRLPYAL